MKTEKHILLVSSQNAPAGSALLSEAPSDFVYHLADSPNTALRLVREKTPISLVVLDGAYLGERGANLYTRLGRENDLPLVWLGGEDVAEPDFGSREPAAQLDGIDASDFEATVRKVMHDGFYPASLVQSLLSASNSVMTTTFQRSLEIGTPWLKMSGMIYGNVAAVVPFRTEKLLGHVMCAGEREHLADLGVDIGFDLAEGDRRIGQAVLAEIANVVAGRLAMDCENLLGTMKMGLPLVFAGEGMDIHSPDKKPAVCVDVDDDWGKLHCEFIFQRAEISGETDTEMATAGDVLLF